MGDVTAPGGGLLGNSNYLINSNCNPITQLVVTINNSGAIEVPLGMSYQLNCWSPAGVNCVWQQYCFIFTPSSGGLQIGWMIDNWPSDAYRKTLKISSTSDLINQGARMVTVTGSPSTLPANYTFTIALTTTGAGNVVSAVDFTIVDNDNKKTTTQPIQLVGLPVSNGTAKQKIDSSGIAAVNAVSLNIVGDDNGACTLANGGPGTIKYAATSPLRVANAFPFVAGGPICVAADGTGTEEQSNVTYGGLEAGPASSFTQTFACPDAQMHPGGWLVASQNYGVAGQTCAFAIAPNGRLHVWTVAGGGAWTGPTPIGATNMAPPGADIAVSQRFGVSGQTDVFFVGNNGQLQMSSASGSGAFSAPTGIGPTGLAPAGAHVAASQQFGADNQTDVFLVGANGQLQVFWANGAGGWAGPEGIGPTGFAPPGAPVAASQHFGISNHTDVFLVNNSAQLTSFWVQGAGAWGGPSNLSGTGFASLNSHVAAGQQFGAEDQTNVYVVGVNGQLSVFWSEDTGPWNGPVAISATGFAPTGACISVGQQFGAENQTNVAVVDTTGRMNIFYVENASEWAGPVQISPATYAPPGCSTTTSAQFPTSANQTDVFVINNAGQASAAFVQSANPWGGPVLM